MSRIFFTADLHLGHGNIIKYARRPQLRAGDLNDQGDWVSGEIRNARAAQMNEQLIAQWNQRVHPDDVVYVLGDFCCYGRERGVEGSRTKAEEWMRRLNGTKIHILGNHDANNGIPRGLDSAVFSAAGERIYLSHRPPLDANQVDLSPYTAAACGHVHGAWATKYVTAATGRTVVIINVGVDVQRYAPVRLDELLGQISKARRLDSKEASNDAKRGDKL